MSKPFHPKKVINPEIIMEPNRGINPFAISLKDKIRFAIPTNIKIIKSPNAIITIGKTQSNG